MGTRLIKVYLALPSIAIDTQRYPMSRSHDNGKVHPKTKVLFGKLKQIAKMFDGIDDIDDLAMKMHKRKRNEEE
ncbi:MAG: hypothetical protein EZS28_013582, partial [Streblomastix strix]